MGGAIAPSYPSTPLPLMKLADQPTFVVIYTDWPTGREREIAIFAAYSYAQMFVAAYKFQRVATADQLRIEQRLPVHTA